MDGFLLGIATSIIFIGNPWEFEVFLAVHYRNWRFGSFVPRKTLTKYVLTDSSNAQSQVIRISVDKGFVNSLFTCLYKWNVYCEFNYLWSLFLEVCEFSYSFKYIRNYKTNFFFTNTHRNLFGRFNYHFFVGVNAFLASLPLVFLPKRIALTHVIYMYGVVSFELSSWKVLSNRI